MAKAEVKPKSEEQATAQIGSRNTALGSFREAFRSWWSGESFQMGAALAYYAVFSVGPVVLLLVSIAGFVFGEQAARGILFGRLQDMLGSEVASAVEVMLAAAYRPATGIITTVIGVVSLVFIATGFFAQLRYSLNGIFGGRNKTQSAVGRFLRRRLAALLMILALGVILLALLATDTAIAAIGGTISGWLSLPEWTLRAGAFLTSFLLVTLVLFLLFHFLPDEGPSRRSSLIGAAVAAFLFSVGKMLLGLYLGRTTTVSVYGAAGAVVVVLLAAYYFSQIVFLGAYLCRAFSKAR